MNYRSVADAARDVSHWVERLPRDIDMVVGIPRSGMLVASLLALNLQVPVASLDEVLADAPLTVGKRLRSRGLPTQPSAARRMLIVDDSVYEGKAMQLAKDRLDGHPSADRAVWGALYSRRAVDPALLDVYYDNVEMPRVFQWNVLDHSDLPKFCMDMDGVLCSDPDESQSDDGPAYDDFLKTAAARTIPTTKIGWIVTARLESHRPQTEDWLRRHGVQYGELIMYPSKSAAERRARGDHAVHKANAYKRTGAELFIESDINQANVIAAATGLPVFCTGTQVMVYPQGESSAGVQPHPWQRARWRVRNIVNRRYRNMYRRHSQP